MYSCDQQLHCLKKYSQDYQDTMQRADVANELSLSMLHVPNALAPKLFPRDNTGSTNDTHLYNKPFHWDHSSNALLERNGVEGGVAHCKLLHSQSVLLHCIKNNGTQML